MSPPNARSLLARAPGRVTPAQAAFWAGPWKQLLDPPADAELRAARLGHDLRRWQDVQADIIDDENQLEVLLAQTLGLVPTSLPGVATSRAAALYHFTLPIERWATPERLYSATGSRLCWRLLQTHEPFDEHRYAHAMQRGR